MFTDEINKGMVSIYHSGKTLTIHQHVIIPESGVRIVIAASAPSMSYSFTPDYQLRSYKQQ